jgi:lysozyme
MKASDKCILLIKNHEGYRPKAYKCPAGVWTVGFGSTVGVTQGIIVTELQAVAMLRNHLSTVERNLDNLKLAINQNQFDALVSFIYNVGFTAFLNSGLLRTIRIKADSPTIRFEFAKWVKAGINTLPGLIRRRADESNLYFS